MLKIFHRIKNLFGNDGVFSSVSVLPFSKYRKDLSKSDFLTAYEISLYVNRALDIRARKVGEIEFTLNQGDKVIENHEITDLLVKPNHAFTGSEFWGLYQKCMDIFGEVYLLKDSELRMGGKTKINQLHLLKTYAVKPFFDEETGELLKIEHRTDKKTEMIKGDQIIYAHNPDPRNPIRGESRLRAGMRQIETGVQIDEYQSKVLENGGRVEGVFKFKTDRLTKKQLQELKDGYQEEYAEASKAGLPLFMGGDANFERLALSPAELAYLESKKMTLDDICILTGVPKALLALASGETFANAEAAIRIFLREEIAPAMKSLAMKLDEMLVPDELDLWFIDPTPENKEEKRKDLETANAINAVTLNEKREMIGLDPIENGDEIYAPFNLAPLGKIEEPKKETKKKIYHPLKEKDNRRAYHSIQLKKLDRRSQTMKSAIVKYFTGQRDRIIEKLEVQKHFRKKDLLGEIFNETLEIKLAKDTVLPILAQLLKEAGEDSKVISGSDWEFNETAEIQSWLDKKTDIFAQQINKTTFKKLKEEFQQSLEEGEGRRDLVKRIKETYGNISTSRAEVIARTETHGVTQYGTIQGYKQAGMPIKIWVWSPGTKGGAREIHQAMDGEEKPIDTSFSNGQMFPGEGPASEVVNCECFI